MKNKHSVMKSTKLFFLFYWMTLFRLIETPYFCVTGIVSNSVFEPLDILQISTVKG